MGTQGESFVKKTQKGLSILTFETTKQSRILKKRMRTAALQKEVKADLRDLGNLVYNAIINDQDGILKEEETKILVENIRDNKNEVERLRDAMARLNRTRKHFEDEEFCFEAPAEVNTAEPAAEPQAEVPPQEQPAAATAQPAMADAEPLLEPEGAKKPTKPKRAPRKTAAKTTKEATKPAEPEETETAASPSSPETKSATGET